MSTPLVATGRIVQPFTWTGLTHLMHLYVRNPQATGGTYNINTRTLDANDLDWKDAGTAIGAWMGKVFSNAVALGTQLLQIRSGSIWNTVDAHSVSPTFSGGAPSIASQLTIVFRDVDFKKVKVVVIEAGFGPPFHVVGYPTGNAGADSLIKEFTPAFTITNAPYIWLVGRGNHYLHTAPAVGLTATLNRKIRRARGLV